MKQYLTTVFCKESRDSYLKLLMRRFSRQLFKAKIYRATTTEAMRQLYMTQQVEDNYYKQEENNKVFSEQLLKGTRLLRL
jgi:hypothetical protein